MNFLTQTIEYLYNKIECNDISGIDGLEFFIDKNNNFYYYEDGRWCPLLNLSNRDMELIKTIIFLTKENINYE